MMTAVSPPRSAPRPDPMSEHPLALLRACRAATPPPRRRAAWWRRVAFL